MAIPAPAPHRAARRLRHDDLRRDVGARRRAPARSTSARASPTPTGRPRCSRPRSRRCATAHNQYPPGPGIPELRAGDRRAPAALLRASSSTPTARCSSPPARPRRSPRRCSRCASPATRSSRSSRTTTPTPRCIALAGRDAPRRHAAPAGLRGSTPTRSPPRSVTAHPRWSCSTRPHNPTGKVFTRAELELIAELCREHDVIAVTDEVYEHLVFDGREHVPLATLPGHGASARSRSPRRARRSRSPAGRSAGRPARARSSPRCRPPSSSSRTSAARRSSPRSRTRSALPDAYFESFRADLQAKRDRLCAGLRGGRARRSSRPAGTYFVTTDIRPLGEHDGLAFCLRAARARRRRRRPDRRVLRRRGGRPRRWSASRSASATR